MQLKKFKTSKPVQIYQGKIKSFFKEFKNIFKENKIYLIVDENTIQHINYLEENFSVRSMHLKGGRNISPCNKCNADGRVHGHKHAKVWHNTLKIFKEL